MGGGSGGGQNTTVTKSDPWAGQQDYLKYGFQQAQNQYQGSTPSYYPNSTVAAQSPYTTQAMTAQATRATNGSPIMSSANTGLTNTINGNYLNSNPYMDANFNAGAVGITNAYNQAVNGQTAGAEGAGRYGSGMQAFQKNQANQTLASGLGNLYNQTYFQNYNNERQNQMGAIQMAPTAANQDYTDLGKLSDVGSAQQQYAQSLTDADVNKFNFNTNLQGNKLGQYLGLIQGNYGGSTSTQTPLYGSSMLGNVLGAGALAAGAYGALGGSK